MSYFRPATSVMIDISDDDDLSTEGDLGDLCDEVAIVIPSLDSCNVSLQVKDPDMGNTYQDLGNNQTTMTTTGGYTTTFKLGGWRYVKVKTSAGQSADRTFYLRGIRY